MTFELTYKESDSKLEILGEFEEAHELASIIVEECTLIHTENGEDYRDDLLLRLSCWTLKLMAMGPLYSAGTQLLIDGESMVYTYPGETVGKWTIRKQEVTSTGGWS